VNMSGTSLHSDSASAAPSSASGRVFSGIASFYGNASGRQTASGQRFDQNELSCAHRSLPFGTKLRVTHGGRSVVVTVNDRGPFIRGRVLDLSIAAARAVGLTSAGSGLVTAEIISLSDGVWRAPARKSTGTRFGLERLQIVGKQGECRGNDLRSSSPGNIAHSSARSSGGLAPERAQRRWPHRGDSPPEILESVLVATTPRPYRRISSRKGTNTIRL
jgi:rare lipoprotein A (peptidoglycan hydrolase)